MRALARKRLLFLLFAGALLPACPRRLSLQVELVAALSPDPFTDVREVHLEALVSGQVVPVGGGRWDQGPLELPAEVDPLLDHLLVLGTSTSGAVLASGVSAPLDLLHDPPTEPLQLLFSRIGAVSVLPNPPESVRVGGRAQVFGGGVLFAGGVDAAGALREDSEYFDAAALEVSAGPALSGGRGGDFELLALPSGGVVVVSGTVAAGAAPLVVLGSGGASATGPSLPVDRPGAAAAALDDQRVLVAGGLDPVGPSAVAYAFDPATLTVAATESLDLPRAHAAAVAVAGRMLLVGGLGTAPVGDLTAAPLSDAVTFDPGGGSRPQTIALGGALVAPAAVVTAAGSVVIAGGRDASGAPRDSALALVVGAAGGSTAGDASWVAALPVPTAEGELLDLGDGSLLLIPAAGGPLSWIHALPPRVTVVDSGIAGPLSGARGGLGTALLRAPDGRYLFFNAGPAGALGSAGLGEALADGSTDGSGIIPLRPSAWTVGGGTLRGTRSQARSPEGLVPEERAILGATAFSDFQASFSLELEGSAEAAFIFGAAGGDFEEVAFLTGSLAVTTVFSDAAAPSSCQAARPELALPGPHKVRIQRVGLALQVQIDSAPALDCPSTPGTVGQLGVGILAGSAQFSQLSLVGGP